MKNDDMTEAVSFSRNFKSFIMLKKTFEAVDSATL